MQALTYFPAFASAVVATAMLSLPASAGEVITEPNGPAGMDIKLIVVDDGSFVMGSPKNERGRAEREGPQKTITFPDAFALGLTEVSVGQFKRFVDATSYVTDAEKHGEGEVFDGETGRLVKKSDVNWRHDFLGDEADESLPVLRVSWSDANAFLEWLSRETGSSYRLPSEAEFEYALRAGTDSPYWWGKGSPDSSVENLSGSRERLNELRWPAAFRNYSDRHWGPSPIGSFTTNPFGLFDMGGNAAEWVADCFVPAISDVPDDGSASTTGRCELRVFRGGSWAYPPPLSRSAYRNAGGKNHHSAMIGFRVAKDLGEATAQR